jgi:molybdopterin-guanine dinucleotide biosynthesis protein A
VDAAILAGGQARRFGGRDKSALHIGGESIFDRQLAVLRVLTDRVRIVTTTPDRFRDRGVEVVRDLLPGAGALGGIYSALETATSSHVLVLACDLPFVTASFLGSLVALAGPAWDAVVPRTADGWQPLCAIYARAVAPAIRRQVEAGRLKITDLFATIAVREMGAADIAATGADETLFLNVNSPRDLERALGLEARRSPRSE